MFSGLPPQPHQTASKKVSPSMYPPHQKMTEIQFMSSIQIPAPLRSNPGLTSPGCNSSNKSLNKALKTLSFHLAPPPFVFYLILFVHIVLVMY